MLEPLLERQTPLLDVKVDVRFQSDFCVKAHETNRTHLYLGPDQNAPHRE